ncbi:MAG: zinc-ribbon domain-containing protein [Deltaproteobacteria bacterium]|nr:zinc-ribbon domain-containing protein [Myxococcales bacterium]MDP3218091.1 zinc-ribbon domain-containing protein [Deltaproteobacteria bacterium]
MDVVCERCKAEYEFDDALVSERGTTVKCTNCSHQFKIFRPTSESDAAKVWNLRRPDGTVIPFDSLAVLQKWILEGKVSKMDEISRAGEGWKSLGAIAELESFFATAELRASQNAPGRTGQRFPSMSGVRAPTPAPGISRSNPARASRPPPAMSSPTIRPGGAAPPPPPVSLRAPSHGGASPPPVPNALRGPSAVKSGGAPAAPNTMVQIPPPPKMPAEMGPSPSPPPIADRHEPLADEVERARSRPASLPPKVLLPPLPALSTPPRDLVDDQAPTRSMASDPRALRGAPVAGRRSGLGVGLVVGALVAGGVLLFSYQTGVFGPAVPSAGANATRDTARRDRVITDAVERSRRYTPAAMDEAREELSAAIVLRPDDAALIATRAAVLAAWSEMSTQQAADLDAQSSLPGADAPRLQASAELARREGTMRKDRARTDLRAAEAAIETVAPAERALVEARLADVARVVGAPTLANHLEGARRGAPTNESSLYLALATLTDDPMSATAGLRAAIGADPQNQRARVALARLLQRQGDVRGAQELLAEALRAEPEHEALLGLSRALGATTVVATPTATDAGTPDAGVTVAAVTTPVAPPTAPVVPPAAPPTAPVAAPTAAPVAPRHGSSDPNGSLAAAMAPTRDYDRLVRDADTLQHAGRTSLARERYQQALAVRATGSEALTGLGFVELDQNAVGAAISRFRQALASNPRYSEAYIGLGEAYSQQRSYGQAVQAYQQYLTINPGGSRSEMARRQIESLQERMNAARAPEAPGDDAATSP